MKIHILHEFQDGPWGGGNQFLKALREQWRAKDLYAENFDEADVYLINSFPFRHMEYFLDSLKEKEQNGKKIFYRLDGLFYKNRISDKEKYIDNICTFFVNNFTDGVIYQTEWIKKIQQEFGIDKNIENRVCINAPDSSIFNRKDIDFPKNGEKIKLVATCWAPNARKGFQYYKFLDDNLDFNKYEMTFIGNSSVEFKNIKLKKPLPTKELAKELENYHIFVSCAFDEPCSNSLVEAMHLGMPALVHNSGGSPEIIGKAGEKFDSEENIIENLDKLSTDVVKFSKNIDLPSIEDVADNYYNFMLERYNAEDFKQVDENLKKDFVKLLKANKLLQNKLFVKCKNTYDFVKNFAKRVVRKVLKCLGLMK